MRIRHKINHGWSPDRTDPDWADRVEREADEQTAARQRRYLAAAQRLDRAEQKLEKAVRSAHAKRNTIAALQLIVEQRRQELLEIQRIMQQSPAGSQHRGTTTYRGVPGGSTL